MLNQAPATATGDDLSLVRSWFLKNGLSWNSDVELKLSAAGVKFVEHLKMFEAEEWEGLFEGETLIARRQAGVALRKLKDTGEFDPTKCTLEQVEIDEINEKPKHSEGGMDAELLGTDESGSGHIVGLENAPDDQYEVVPMPSPQIGEMEADEMDRAINAIISAPSEAPMSAAQIAQFYDEMETKKCSKTTMLEIVEDNESPISADDAVMLHEDDAKESPLNMEMEPARQREASVEAQLEVSDQMAESTLNPSSSDGQQQDTTIHVHRTTPPSMLPGQSDSSVSAPMVDAWPVDDQTRSVYDAVEVRDPWWKQHQRFIILALLLVVFALVAILGASLLTRSDDTNENNRSSEISPSPKPTIQYPPQTQHTLSPIPIVTTKPELVSITEQIITESSPSTSGTEKPTNSPTGEPTTSPAKEPTAGPTREPTSNPTNEPTAQPTPEPTPKPTDNPTPNPRNQPTPFPTKNPTKFPTNRPTPYPMRRPTKWPTRNPTKIPTNRPTSPPIPKNNDCTGAEIIAWPGENAAVTVSGSTIGATDDDTGIPSTCGISTGKGVWYALTLPRSSHAMPIGPYVTFSTCNQADFDTRISVFGTRGGDCSGAHLCDNNQDDSGICGGTTEHKIKLSAGSTYHIIVHGFGETTGSFSLTVSTFGWGGDDPWGEGETVLYAPRSCDCRDK